jgi:hypothetical protein
MVNEREEQRQFNAICEPLDEFEPIPTVVTSADYEHEEPTEEQEREPLDGYILAGLVAP